MSDLSRTITLPKFAPQHAPHHVNHRLVAPVPNGDATKFVNDLLAARSRSTHISRANTILPSENCSPVFYPKHQGPVPVPLHAHPIPNNNNNDVVTVNGETGVWVNKEEVVNWNGELPINQYPINQDPNPTVIRKKPNENIVYNQNVSVRYLEPPTPPPHGDIIIKEQPNIPTAPAPPLVIRQEAPPTKTPPPLVLREAPPQPPTRIPTQIFTVPGKRLRPPPRQVVVEKLPPIVKPRDVVLERWLPYKQPSRRVIYDPAPQERTVTVTKEVPVYIREPVYVEVPKPVPVPQRVPVPQPVPVPVPQQCGPQNVNPYYNMDLYNNYNQYNQFGYSPYFGSPYGQYGYCY